MTIRYRMSGYPTSPTSGQLLATLPGTRSSTATYTQTSFLYHTQYYYAAFAMDSSGNYSSTATVIAPTPGDFDRDGDIDMGDFAHFQSCLTGFAIPQYSPSCLDARMDPDEDVGSSDLNVMLKCMSGANTTVPADCGMSN